MTIRLSEIVDKLPQDAQVWIKGMGAEELHCTEIILNNVGQESFTKHWKEHMDHSQEVRIF
jgi:hypothetical protein